ncbi:MAG: hypothetical protein ACHQZQ_03815 [SAR324 cluster bacterium]
MSLLRLANISQLDFSDRLYRLTPAHPITGFVRLLREPDLRLDLRGAEPR